MGSLQLSLGTVSAVEAGEVARTWNSIVERAIRDCSNRPGETRVRKVILQAEFTPTPGEEGAVDEIDVAFQVQDKFPPFSTGSITMRIRKRGQQLMLAFEDEPMEEESE